MGESGSHDALLQAGLLYCKLQHILYITLTWCCCCPGRSRGRERESRCNPAGWQAQQQAAAYIYYYKHGVVVVQGGHVAESGNHDALLQAGRLYSKLQPIYTIINMMLLLSRAVAWLRVGVTMLSCRLADSTASCSIYIILTWCCCCSQ
jgi:hypothetical protein